MSHRWKNQILDESRIYLDHGVREHGPRDVLFHLPPRIYREHLKDPLLGGLVCTGAGAFHRTLHHRVDRPGGFPAHTLQLVLEGEGWIQVGSDPTVPVKAPRLLWLTGEEPYRYGSDERNPWTVWHVAGIGPAMGLHRRRMPLGPGEFHVPIRWEGDALIRIKEALLRVQRSFLEGPSDLQPPWQSHALREVLLLVQTLLRGQLPPRKDLNHRLTEYLSHRLRDDLTLEGIAKDFARPARAFAREVKEALGESPLTFRNRLRMEEARTHLAAGLSVSSAARMVGVGDALYFSRLYRRFIGHPPREEKRR